MIYELSGETGEQVSYHPLLLCVEREIEDTNF